MATQRLPAPQPNVSIHNANQAAPKRRVAGDPRSRRESLVLCCGGVIVGLCMLVLLLMMVSSEIQVETTGGDPLVTPAATLHTGAAHPLPATHLHLAASDR